MTNKKQKIIFVDFYGILSTTKFWFSMQNPEHKLHSYLTGMQDFLFASDRVLIKDWMRGKYSSEDIHQLLAKNFNLDFDEILTIFIEDCKRIETSKLILEKLRSLKEKYLLVMVTDNMDCFDRFFLPENKILQETFDEICNSFNFKKLKNDNNGEIFLDILQKYGIPITDCCVIDDSMFTCDTFQRLGGKYYNSRTEEEVLEALNNFV